MILKDLLFGLKIIDTNLDTFDFEISKICSDSNDVIPDSVFICIAGLHRDGHDFINEAVRNGAAVIIIQEELSSISSCRYIRVENTRIALSVMWSNSQGSPADYLKIIAVTGTNGKSTTVHMLKAILEEAGHKCGLLGTLTNSLTTPDPCDLYPLLKTMVDDKTEYVVMEASSHSLALDKLAPIKFEGAIFTNLTPEHLDFHKNMEDYALAKARLFKNAKIGIFNYDDPYSTLVTADSECEKYSFSAKSCEADFCAKNIKCTLDHTDFEFLTINNIFHVSIPIAGFFNVYNAMAAITCTYLLGIDPICISKALSKFVSISGRLERVKTKSDKYSVFIDYAHTPDALENVLKTVRKCMKDNQRLVLLFGCGGDRDRTKRAPMGKIASHYADYVIITSDNCRSEEPYAIIHDILKGVDKKTPYLIIADRRRAIEYAIHSAREGDIILLCGKGHENYEINNKGRFPFNEKEIIKAAEAEIEQ